MFGVESPKVSMDGSQVSNVFWKDGDHDKIKGYCENDVRTVMEIMKKSCF
jgi:hypothetical protein